MGIQYFLPFAGNWGTFTGVHQMFLYLGILCSDVFKFTYTHFWAFDKHSNLVILKCTTWGSWHLLLISSSMVWCSPFVALNFPVVSFLLKFHSFSLERQHIFAFKVLSVTVWRFMVVCDCILWQYFDTWCK